MRRDFGSDGGEVRSLALARPAEDLSEELLEVLDEALELRLGLLPRPIQKTPVISAPLSMLVRPLTVLVCEMEGSVFSASAIVTHLIPSSIINGSPRTVRIM